MVYIIDIDGTICSLTEGDYDDVVPFYDKIKVFNKLHDSGHTIIYWTARGMGRFGGDSWSATTAFYDLTRKQLEEWGVKFSELKLGKPSYDYWIDDKTISFEDVKNTMKM